MYRTAENEKILLKKWKGAHQPTEFKPYECLVDFENNASNQCNCHRLKKLII